MPGSRAADRWLGRGRADDGRRRRRGFEPRWRLTLIGVSRRAPARRISGVGRDGETAAQSDDRQRNDPLEGSDAIRDDRLR